MEYKILYSKVQIPEIQKNLIIRERLLKKLDNIKQKIVILHGTVGYGKTVLLSQYIRLYEIPCAWYHLDAIDNSMLTFLEYLTAALSHIWQDFSFSFGSYVETEAGPDTEQLSRDFVVYLNGFLKRQEHSGRRIALVLDDFQSVQNPEIFLFISRLATHSFHNLRLFLATKSSLPEFCAAFIVRDEAQVIGMDELAFMWEEVSNVLERILHQDIAPEVSGNVYKKTEGWPAGTMFMAQYFRRTGGVSSEPDWEVVSDEALIQNYIMNELFCKLSYDIQQFLIKTSVLDELSVDLCNYSLGITDARSTLNYLIQEGMFILRIDKGSGYYRYHSIFKMFLMRSIFPVQKKEILDRAAAWYLKRGNIDRALACWIQNDSRDEVARGLAQFEPMLIREKQDDIVHRCRVYLNMEDIPEKQENAVLLLRYFGSFRAVIGEDGHEMAWRTKKTAELFAYLAIRGQKAVKRDALLKLLWPEDFPNNAVAMLHNMFYNLRKELTPYGQNERIQYVNKEYSMDTFGIDSDLELIDESCRAVEAKDMIYLAQHGERFYEYWGVFLEDMENSWCVQKRYYYEKCFLDGCELLGQYFIKKGRYTSAVKVLKAGLGVDTYSESMALMLMKCYARLQERKEGKRFYEKLCRIYRSDLGISPGRGFVSAYEECIRG